MSRSKIEKLGLVDQVVLLHRGGKSSLEISKELNRHRKLGVSRESVRRWLQSQSGQDALNEIRVTATQSRREQNDETFQDRLKICIDELILIGRDVSIDARVREQALNDGGQLAVVAGELDVTQSYHQIIASRQE